VTRFTATIALLLAIVACKPIPDTFVQQLGDQTLLLPERFETWSLTQPTDASEGGRTFALSAYQAEALIPFAYGDGITGFAAPFDTDFEAQRRHAAAVASIRGTTPVNDRDSETVADYDGVFFFNSEDPSLMFHIGSHVVFMNAASTGVSRTSSLRRALAFAERLFELNDLLGTRPLRPFQLDPLSFSPPTTTPIIPGPTRFTLDVAYILEDQPSGHVSAQVRWFKAGRGLTVFADSTRVSRGTGEVSFNWDIDLTDGAFSDILSIRAHISYATNDGRIIVPNTSFIEQIRYNIARTNN